MIAQPALIDAVSTLLTAQYYTFATFAFVTYDWLINLDEEIRCFWDFSKGCRFTAAAVLYGLSRYPPIILIILQLRTIFPMSDKAYVVRPTETIVLSIIPFSLTPAIFSAIRVYTLSPERKITAVATFLILFVPAFIISTLNATDTPEVLPSPFNCTNNPAPHSLKRSILARSGAPSVLALGNLATYASPPLTAILICRFLFDLRQADRTTAAASSPSGMQSLNLDLDFNVSVHSQGHRSSTLPAFVASMGEPVYTGIRFVDEIRESEGVPTTNNGGERNEGCSRARDRDELCGGDMGPASV
ncbi:hypothetical protein GSI_04962 [Ganoderma sinense ZZ0214-1]|uniref:DUF6533 domain-containing protein n=1 Tax=Ganoderma sinense ZZ0214-1 TaxID=1077348 RepID=A0A2G8SGE0_9APHY|nr:hypothetical protein GSI_04962 [Ganoderma sinense ZZ0214-1]